ncbi:MAG: oxidoreductase [Bacillales bacterium]|nr:oxidoreductase [Bacillales bacterium]
MKEKVALIAGSSGLVGNELLHIILNSKEYEKVYSLVRRPLGIEHPKLVEVICDFDNLNAIENFFNVDDVYCCLGTTIKKAKTKEAMHKIDVEYPIAIAKLAHSKGATHFLLISSMSANSKSRIWYSKMKGELEDKLQAIPFNSISILRPSLLLGNRKEFRLGEKFASNIFYGLSFVLKDSWKSQFGIEAKTVAEAMHTIAKAGIKGTTIYPSNKIAEIVSNS